MILYLCRHAIAEEPASGQGDAERALTPEGIRKFRQAARGFVRMGVDVSHVFTSPLLRARQTAEILAEAFAHEKRSVELVISKPLGAAPRLKAFLEELAGIKGRDVVAVGHEPALGQWIGELCFGSVGRVQLKKGAIAAIELQRERGEMLWLLQPGQLRELV